MSVARLCAYDRPKADIYANVRINNLIWKFGHEEKKNTYICATGCSFCRVCQYGKCHRTWRRMQTIYCLKQPCWGDKTKGKLFIRISHYNYQAF